MLNIEDWLALVSDNEKCYSIKGYNHTLKMAATIYFDSVGELQELVENQDIEFFGYKDKFKIDCIESLEIIIYWDDKGISDEDIQQYINLYNDNFVSSLYDAKKYHNDHVFVEWMNNYDLGYYVVNEGLFGVCIPETLSCYLDYGKIGKDCRMDLSECGNYLYFNS